MITIEIHKLLGTSRLGYKNDCDRLFNFWCEEIAKRYAVPERLLQTNTKLYSWWLRNYNAQAYLFVDDAKSYHAENIEAPEAYQQMFNHYLNHLLTIYPGAIITSILKNHKSQTNAKTTPTV